jgi:predicted N-acyltransferase
MPDGEKTVTLAVESRIADIQAADWDACAGTANPFVSHAFLSALEDSGAVTAKTGWLPQHLALRDAAGRLIGAAPAYLKSHSYGEYVFDWGWAEAFERAGGKYYPKLQAAVPFTPVTGPRLLSHPDADRAAVADVLARGLVEVVNRHGASSCHVTFCTQEEWTQLGDAGHLCRVGQQFHWRNEGYRTFDDFLAALASRKRKMIRNERRDANADGIVIETLTGDALEPRHMDAFYGFYLDTVDRKTWSRAYLNRTFFRLLGERLRDKVVLVLASHGGRYVAGALNFRGSDTLFGRNWGCAAHFKGLYFEACFYRAIDFAIAHGLARVEAGAQGPHKVSRGYLPAETYSAHWIREPGFRRAIADFLVRERSHVEAEMAGHGEASPFRRGPLSTPPGG